MRSAVAALTFVIALAAPAFASPREARIPLRHGNLHVADLCTAATREMHLPGLRLYFGGDVNLTGLRGSLFVAALNRSLGDGCRVTLGDDALVLHLDTEKLPGDMTSAKRAARVFTEEIAPEATAAQRRGYGLRMPREVDPSRPMVILVHGLDCDGKAWKPMTALLAGEGYQVAYFNYPDDEGIDESAALLGENMKALRETFPALRTEIVAHSMGALVAREYIEGADYAGGVHHLILLAPPNAGSKWAPFRFALEAEEHYWLARHDRNWRPSWIITDGLGEAGRDLKPGSRFLKRLNETPRRDGVNYTIIAGSRSPANRLIANALGASARVVPDSIAGCWGLRQLKGGLQRRAESLAGKPGSGDGVVSVESSKLAGVEDFVVLPTDHASLYCGTAEQPPAAWDTIKDRLSR